MLIVIPMSGSGSRYIKAGYKDPKPLIEINGKYMIEYVIEQFSPDDTYIFICNKTHIETTNMKGILDRIVKNKYIYEIDEHKLGPVYAIQQVINDIKRLNYKHHLDIDGVIVSYCDYGSIWDYRIFKEYIHHNDVDGCILIYTGFHPSLIGDDEYGYIQVNKANNVIEIQEKKPYHECRFDEKTSNGCYYFRNLSLLKTSVDELIEKEITCKGEYFVSLLFNLLIKDGYKIGYYTIEKILQFGTPQDLEKFIKWSKLFNKLDLKEKNNLKKDESNTILIQAMAGLGSRFDKYNLPKPLLYINNEHMFINIVKQLPYCEKKIFICRQEHEITYNISRIVKNYFDNYTVKTLNYLTEGQSSTVYTIKDDIDPDNSILITACDAGLIYNKDEYKELLDDKEIDIIVFASHNEDGTTNNPTAYAWIELDENNYIKKIYCKEYPFTDSPNNHIAITGTFFFRKSKYFFENHEKLVEKNIRVNNEFYIDQVINECILSGLKIKTFVIDHYLNYGTPNDYMTYHYWNEYYHMLNKKKN